MSAKNRSRNSRKESDDDSGVATGVAAVGIGLAAAAALAYFLTRDSAQESEQQLRARGPVVQPSPQLQENNQVEANSSTRSSPPRSIPDVPFINKIHAFLHEIYQKHIYHLFIIIILLIISLGIINIITNYSSSYFWAEDAPYFLNFIVF